MAKKSTSTLFNEEETKEQAVVEQPVVEDDIVDVDLSIIKRKRFRINKDNNKILELNVSDLNIGNRLSKAYPRLNTLMEEIADIFSSGDIPDDVSSEEFKKFVNSLSEIDLKMRKELDYIFDAPVSTVCDYGGNMWDPVEGAFRYEWIVDKLSKLYESNLSAEVSKMKARVNQRTAKYKNVRSISKKK